AAHPRLVRAPPVRLRLAAPPALVAGAVTVLVIAKEWKTRETKARPLILLTGKVSGSFVRGPLTPNVLTSDAYCGWSKRSVIVHVELRNTSAKRVIVAWRPTYALAGGAPHGTIQHTPLEPGQAENVFVSHEPKGATAGTRIARCSPTFAAVSG